MKVIMSLAAIVVVAMFGWTLVDATQVTKPTPWTVVPNKPGTYVDCSDPCRVVTYVDGDEAHYVNIHTSQPVEVWTSTGSIK